jgi:hypothetical protein
MGILLEHNGEVRLPAGVTAEQIRDLILPHVAEQLRVKHRARNVEVTDGQVRFTGGAFRLVTNWNLLVTVGRGRVEAPAPGDPRVLRYHLSFRQALCFLVVFILLTVAFWGSLPGGFEEGLGVLVFGLVVVWPTAWLMQVGTTRSRFRAFIERSVREALANTSRSGGQASVSQDPTQSPSADS